MTTQTQQNNNDIGSASFRHRAIGRLRHTGRVLVAGLMLGLSPVLAANTLNAMSYSSLPGGVVRIELQLAEPIAKPLSFAIDNPARIALDLPATTLNLKKKSLAIDVGTANNLTAVEARGRTRVVLNLVKLMPYTISTEGNSVFLTLASSGKKATLQTTAAAATDTPAVRPESVIEKVDFRRGPEGEGRIEFTLSDPSVVVDLREQGGLILLDFIDTALPKQLDRRLNVIDFATPVESIDTTADGSNVRVSVKPIGNFEHLAYQSDNLFTLEVKKMTDEQEQKLKRAKFGYTGERLSLNFQDIEVRAVLQLIADFTGLNLVASDTVTGTVTLRLKNVPWDQAMDIILKTKGLGMRKTGNVVMVAPTEEIAAREKLELEAQKQIAELEPLRTEYIQVNYAKASELLLLLQSEANTIMSSRGNVSIDERTNTLIVQDITKSLASIRQLVNQLDKPVRQVLIDSRIVVANETFSKDLGVKFGFSANATTNDGSGTDTIIFGGKATGDTTFTSGTAFNQDGQENMIINLPATAAAGKAAIGLALGKIGSHLLQLELSALQVEGRGEVISNPRVITANQREAVIESGSEIPFQEASSSGATSTSFKKAVLSLRVTPQITPDDRIIMDLIVTNDSQGETVGNIPTINTNNIETQVLVENGETIVLGGIFTSTNNSDKQVVPFFGELPIVGPLFRQQNSLSTKRELLIFVTPKILKDSLSLN